MDAIVTDAQIRSSVAGLRGLGSAGLDVLALAPSRSAGGSWSRYAAGRAIGPDPEHDPAGFVATIERLQAEHGPAIVYPGREVAIDAMLGLPPEVLPFPGEPVLTRLRRKAGLTELAAGSGLRTPGTLVEATAWELLSAPATVPCAVKPTRSPSVLDSTRVVESAVELSALLCWLPPDEPLLIQERVRGPLMSLGLVVSRDGSLVARFQDRASRTWPARAGSSARAVSVEPDENLIARAAHMLSAAGYWGMVEMDLVETSAGPVVVDVNTRFYGCLTLPLACGVNLPAAWHAVVTDGALPVPEPYRVGVTYRWWEADLMAATRGTVGPLLRRAPRPATGAMWASDDPLPGPLLGVQALGGRVTRRLPGEPRRQQASVSASGRRRPGPRGGAT